MSVWGRIANLVWFAGNAPGHARYVRALRHVRATQEEILRRTLRRNADTEYGRAHRFDRIRNVEEFRERVPLTDYDDLHPLIERVARGEGRVLTRDRVRLLEPSSGSTRAAKWIPYTATLQAELRRAIAPWIYDLYRRKPSLLGGPAYWSITPLAPATEPAESRIPVGFESDSAYLGGFFSVLADATLAVPSTLRHERDPQKFRRRTLDHLTACRELRLISVWHPSFLSLLLAPLEGRDLREIWPRLGLISCWGDGHAALHVPDLRRRFPGVEIQAKGLIATEGIVSIPFGGERPLAVTSHFFEFLDARGRARSAWETERGQRYRVVLTTGGGLYRYRLHDLVEVTGFLGEAPCLRFLGKEDHLSDLYGEKLSEGFAADVLERILARRGVRPRFAMLAPDTSGETTRYVLWIEAERLPNGLAESLESALSENPHYEHCVRLGQLARAAVRRTPPDAFGLYAGRLVATGRRLGDVKPSALNPRTDWAEVFAPIPAVMPAPPGERPTRPALP